MKKLLLLTLALSLTLAQLVRAETEQDKRKHKRHAAEAEQQAPAQENATAKRQPVKQQVRQPMAQQSRRVAPARQSRTVAPVQRQAVRSEANLGGRNVQGSPRTSNQATVTHSNRSNRNFDRNSFNVARTRVIRVRHDRNWWRNRFNTTFVLFGGGYYYWWDGYWFPAYGYSPIYNNYAYNEPIYGYNNLAPGQVIENVQLALRDQGYYRGVIDGLVGPQTRGALARYQRDHGLLVTEAIDEPTLVTLGLA
jgi:hypothetical protein